VFDLVLNLNSLDKNQANLLATTTTASIRPGGHFGSSSMPQPVTFGAGSPQNSMMNQQNLFSNARFMPQQQQVQFASMSNRVGRMHDARNETPMRSNSYDDEEQDECEEMNIM
jgi:hypothetical protein